MTNTPEIEMLGIRYAAAEMHHETNMQEVTEQRDRLAEALWSVLNQDDGSAIKAGILLRSLGLQSLPKKEL